MHRIGPWIILLFIVGMLLCGCDSVVDSSMIFSISQFDEFFSITSSEEKECYIAAGKLDAARTGDMFFVPFIKETSHNECSLFVYVYFTGTSKMVSVDSVNLCCQDDSVVFSSEIVFSEMEIIQLTNTYQKGVIKIGTFPKAENWFLDGSTLELSFACSVMYEGALTRNNVLYEVTLMRQKTILMPT